MKFYLTYRSIRIRLSISRLTSGKCSHCLGYLFFTYSIHNLTNFFSINRILYHFIYRLKSLFIKIF